MYTVAFFELCERSDSMNCMIKKDIVYPYLPENREIKYVPAGSSFIQTAYEFARENALDKTMPGAAVIVKDGVIVGRGANGSTYHEDNVCERVVQGSKSGEGYELCEGCHPRNHSEPSAIADAQSQGNDVSGADLYLWGHWWFCEPCWNAMIKAGIRDTYVIEGSDIFFNKENSANIVGRQFDGDVNGMKQKVKF